jgi:tyrosine-protein kinase Etk/Wzc
MSDVMRKTVTETEQRIAAGGEVPDVEMLGANLSPVRRAWVENISLLLEHKKLIILTTVLVTIATGFYAFSLPKMYRATAVVVPARHQEGSALGGLASSLSSTIKDLGVTKIGGGQISYSPLSLISSREVMEKVVRDFQYTKIYDAPLEDAIKNFSENLQGDVSEEGNFVVSFEDEDPARAAKVANAVVTEMNEMNARLGMEEASHNLTYIEERFNKGIRDLDSAEAGLNQFQLQYGVYSLPDQAKGMIAAAAAIEQQRVMTEIQLHNAEQLYGTASTESQLLRSALTDLSSKSAELESGMASKASSLITPTKLLPELALKYLRLMREVELQSKLKAYLLPSYEQAKLDVHKKDLAFLFLDKAVAPTKKSKPKRSVILLSGMLSGFVVSVLSVLTFHRMNMVTRDFHRDQNILRKK